MFHLLLDSLKEAYLQQCVTVVNAPILVDLLLQVPVLKEHFHS